MLPFDLHVLSMPPAFNLSQDQTLHLKLVVALTNYCTFKAISFILFNTQKKNESAHTNYIYINIFVYVDIAKFLKNNPTYFVK